MKFLDLGTQYERIKSQVAHGIDHVLEHGHFIMGEEVAVVQKLY